MYWIFIAVLECVRLSCFVESTFINEGSHTGCLHFECDGDVTDPACGIRNEGGGVRLRVFENECKLQKYGCKVSASEAYRSVSMDYCSTVFDADNDTEIDDKPNDRQPEAPNPCFTFHCSLESTDQVCALRKDGEGYRIRLFQSRCDMHKHNCEHGSGFNETDRFICQDLDASSDDEAREDLLLEEPKKPDLEHVIVINARSVKYRSDLNGSVEEFFASTHKTPLPLDLMPPETRRNMLLKVTRSWWYLVNDQYRPLRLVDFDYMYPRYTANAQKVSGFRKCYSTFFSRSCLATVRDVHIAPLRKHFK